MLCTKYSEEIEKRMKAYFDTLNEKDRRGYAAIEAMKLGHRGTKLHKQCAEVSFSNCHG